MDLSQLADVGEFVGGLAVLVTLLYLAFEARKGRLAREAASVDTLAEGWNSILGILMDNRELTATYLRGNQDPEDLDAVERARYLMIINASINHFQTVKRRFDAGLMPEKEWRTHASGYANVMNTPGGEWALGQIAVTEDVRQVLCDYRDDPTQYSALRGAPAV